MEFIPEDLKYSETHEWVRREDSNILVIGITDYAQSKLGEITFVELPEAGLHIHANDEVCVLEATKSTADLCSPVSGMIVDINENLEDAPGLINSDPYGDGWLYKIKLRDLDEYEELMRADEYQDYIMESEE